MLQRVLTRTTVTGAEFIPAKGPYIAVGNHVAAVETALLVLNLPHVPELIGNGDVPFDPMFSFMAKWYSFIPIRRGHIDRRALTAAREVLDSGNVLGVFPEGGIWEHNAESARPGVAWLSQVTGAPILPIGFGGVRGAFKSMVRLGRPHLTMNIGPLMPPVESSGSGRVRRAAIEAASEEIMRRITALVPSAYSGLENGQRPRETYAFKLAIKDAEGRVVDLPPELAIADGDDLAFYFHRNVLLEVVYRNYKIKEARPLAAFPRLHDPARLGPALDAALEFYHRDPIFLGYRLGYARAARVVDALEQLRAVLAWAEQRQYEVRIIPERTIIKAGEAVETYTEPSVKREY